MTSARSEPLASSPSDDGDDRGPAGLWTASRVGSLAWTFIGVVLAVAPHDAPALLRELPDGWVVGDVIRQRDDRQVVVE